MDVTVLKHILQARVAPYEGIVSCSGPLTDNVNEFHVSVTDGLNVYCVYSFPLDKGVFCLGWCFNAHVSTVDAPQNVREACDGRECELVSSELLLAGWKCYRNLGQFTQGLGDAIDDVTNSCLCHAHASPHHPLEAAAAVKLDGG